MPLHINKAGEVVEKSTLTDFEKSIIAAFELHIKLMFADEWYTTVKFEPVESEAMETECSPEYRTAKISVDAEKLQSQPEYIAHYVRHELLHVLLWQVFSIVIELCYKRTANAITKLEESAVYSLEHMPFWKRLYEKSISDEAD